VVPRAPRCWSCFQSTLQPAPPQRMSLKIPTRRSRSRRRSSTNFKCLGVFGGDKLDGEELFSPPVLQGCLPPPHLQGPCCARRCSPRPHKSHRKASGASSITSTNCTPLAATPSLGLLSSLSAAPSPREKDPGISPRKWAPWRAGRRLCLLQNSTPLPRLSFPSTSNAITGTRSPPKLGKPGLGVSAVQPPSAPHLKARP